MLFNERREVQTLHESQLDDNKPREQLGKTGLANYFQQKIHRYIPAGFMIAPSDSWPG